MFKSCAQGLLRWIDERFPLSSLWREHLSEYYAPKNFNFWYFFGSLALLVLVNQIVTGIWLTMNYNPSAEGAFASVESIMRDVDYGWLLRYLHTTGASFFFIVIYFHMFRAFLYGSYKAPRELLWLVGMAIFLALMAEAFMGYLLPWGQMSFWGAQVITSLFGALPWIGPKLQIWIMGDYTISGATLNRFFSLHVIAIPLVILGLVFAHILALHEVGSNNPDGIEIKKNKNTKGHPVDGIPFHPYYTVKDLYGVGVFLLVFCSVVFFMPEGGGYFLEAPNFVAADPMQTPEHIAPVWYFTPFYSILRAIPDKLLGVIFMAASVAVLFVMPWLDRSPVRSIRYKGPLFKIALAIFVVAFLGLGYLGTLPPTPMRAITSQILVACYFAFFILMPFYTRWDSVRTVPDRLQGAYLNVWSKWLLVLSGVILFLLFASKALASENIPLQKAPINLKDQASLQRGAKYFMGFCSGCHSLKYVRYSRMAKDIGITNEKGEPLDEVVKRNLIFTGAKIGDTVKTALNPKQGAKWFGIAPPDLSLEVRARGADWLYTYLKSFYSDPQRPWGVNNLVFPNVAMPHILEPLQGQQILEGHEAPLLIVKKPGQLTAKEYDQVVLDVVNFLTYMSEPVQLERQSMGIWVILFLVIFTLLAYLLKREYWKELH